MPRFKEVWITSPALPVIKNKSIGARIEENLINAVTFREIGLFPPVIEYEKRLIQSLKGYFHQIL